MTTPADSVEAVYDAIAARVRAGQPGISNKEIAGLAGVALRTAQNAIHALVGEERINRWRPANASQFTPYHYGIVGLAQKDIVPARPARLSEQDELDARIQAHQGMVDDLRRDDAAYARIIKHNSPGTMDALGTVANAYALAKEKGVEITPGPLFRGVIKRRPKPRHFPQCQCGLAYHPKDGEDKCIVCIEAAVEEPTACAQCGNGFYPAHASVLLCSECAYA